MLLLWPAVSLGQADPLDIESMIRKRPVVGEEKKEEKPEVRPPDESLVQLGVQWSQRREADNDEARDRLFEDYVQIAARLGLPSRPYEARVLIEESAAALEKGDEATARKRLEQARRLAPQMPMVEFAQLSLVLKTTPQDVFALGRHLSDGYAKSWSFLPSRFGWAVKLVSVLWVSLCLFGLALALALVVRHVGLLADDLKRVLPEGVARLQVLLLLALLLGAPLLLTGSLLVSAVAAAALLGVYMSWPERAAVAATLGALALLPQAFALSGAGMSFPGSEASELAAWGSLGCEGECVEALESRIKEGGDVDPRIAHARQFLRVSEALRRGPASGHAGARATLKAMMDDKTLPREMRPAVLNNLGVSEALTGDLVASRESFEVVAQMNPEDWRSWINLARVAEMSGDNARVEALVQQAIKLGQDEAAQRATVEDRTIGVWFHFEELPMEPLFEAHLASVKPDDGLAAAHWARLGGDLPLDSMPLLAGGALSVLFITSLIGRVAGAARHCPRCGGSMGEGRSDLTARDGETCTGCTRCFEGRGSISYTERVSHEGKTERFGRVSLWSWRVGNVVLPGLGAVLCGSAWGLMPLLLVSLGVGGLWMGQEILGDAWRSLTLWADGSVLISGALLALAAVVALALLWLGPPIYKPRATAAPVAPRRPPKRGLDREAGDGAFGEDGD